VLPSARAKGASGTSRLYVSCERCGALPSYQLWAPTALPSARAKGGQQHQQALYLLRVMQSHALVPEEVSCRAAVSVGIRGPQQQQALQLSRAMQRPSVVWDVVPYSAAVSTGEECQQCQQASYLLRAMQHLDIVPVVLTHRAWGQPVQGRQGRRRGALLRALL